jgi:hypothetical protein
MLVSPTTKSSFPSDIAGLNWPFGTDQIVLPLRTESAAVFFSNVE